jgi:hypothetical protein
MYLRLFTSFPRIQFPPIQRLQSLPFACQRSKALWTRQPLTVQHPQAFEDAKKDITVRRQDTMELDLQYVECHARLQKSD